MLSIETQTALDILRTDVAAIRVMAFRVDAENALATLREMIEMNAKGSAMNDKEQG